MTAAADARDLSATVAGLYIYPVKSCAGVALPEVLLTEAGLEFDRAWMVVDATGEFVTQRELPRMALIRPRMKQFEMVLRAPGMLALHVAFDRVEAATRVSLWNEEVDAFDMGDIAAQWFSDFLSEPGRPQRLRLVRFDPAVRRLSTLRWTDGVEALNLFSDGFAVLVASQASLDEFNERMAAAGHAPVGMERFRPNIVLAGVQAQDEDRVPALHIETEQGEAELKAVKPCPRCPIPDIDPATGMSSPEVGDVLRTYRHNPRLGGAVTFGMNCIVVHGGEEGAEHALRIGQRVTADFRFD